MRDEQWVKDNVNWITKEQTSRNNEIIKEVRTHQLKGNKASSRPQYYGIDLCWRCFAFLDGVSLSLIKELKQGLQGH